MQFFRTSQPACRLWRLSRAAPVRTYRPWRRLPLAPSQSDTGDTSLIASPRSPRKKIRPLRVPSSCLGRPLRWSRKVMSRRLWFAFPVRLHKQIAARPISRDVMRRGSSLPYPRPYRCRKRSPERPGHCQGAFRALRRPPVTKSNSPGQLCCRHELGTRKSKHRRTALVTGDNRASRGLALSSCPSTPGTRVAGFRYMAGRIIVPLVSASPCRGWQD